MSGCLYEITSMPNLYPLGCLDAASCYEDVSAVFPYHTFQDMKEGMELDGGHRTVLQTDETDRLFYDRD